MMICSQSLVTIQRACSRCGLSGVVFFFLFMSAGCSTVPDDNQDGLFGTLQQLDEGVYEKRLRQSEQQLSKLKQQQQIRRKELASVRKQRTSEQARVQRLSRHAERQQAHKAHAAKKVRSLQEQRRLIRQQIQAMEKEMALLDEQLAKQRHGADHKFDELIRQRDILRKQLGLLIEQSL